MFGLSKRFFSVLTFIFWSQLGFCQATQPQESLFKTIRPDIIVVVSKHPTGADMFSVRALDPDFSPKVLNQCITDFGAMLGDSPRGINITEENIGDSGGKKGKFFSATFAVSGFWKAGDSVKLQCLVRAFASNSIKPAVYGMDVILAGGVPSKNIIQSLSNDEIQLQAQAIGSPPAIEYRIKINSHDPNSIIIPDSIDSATVSSASIPKKQNVTTIIFVLIGLLAVLAFVLVYNLSIAWGRKSNSMPKK